METGMFAIAHAVAVLGACVGIAGGGIGIGIVGAHALDAIARQPEERKAIRTNMLLMAALIEGLSFFGAVIALIVVFESGPTKNEGPAVDAKDVAAPAVVVQQVGQSPK